MECQAAYGALDTCPSYSAKLCQETRTENQDPQKDEPCNVGANVKQCSAGSTERSGPVSSKAAEDSDPKSHAGGSQLMDCRTTNKGIQVHR